MTMNKLCEVDGCTKLQFCKGLCTTHYKRKWRHGHVDAVITPMNFERGTCIISDCNDPMWASNSPYCRKHHQRFYRYGRTENIIADKGSGTTNKSGYRVLTINGKRVYEHTYLAERALGRPLPPKAVIHHLNGNPGDNHTKLNIVICPDQAYHLLLHRRARELGDE